MTASPLASLFMYQRPELTDSHNRYWALIRAHLHRSDIDSPKTLKQIDGDVADWEDPGLVFSQTCGMPYRMWLHDKVELIGTPDYGLDECAPGYYRSAIIVRADDPRTQLRAFENAVLAFNSTDSQSGYAAPLWHARHHGFEFNNRLQVGAHLNAGSAVVNGEADIAALDAVSWTLMRRYADFAPRLRVLEWTTPTPGLPYIASKDSNVEAIFSAVAAAIAELNEDDKNRLLLKGLVRISKKEYLAVKNPE